MTSAPVQLALPLAGRSLVQNSPADRTPSHGTDLFGLTYAVDLVPVDTQNRSARRGLRSWLTAESPEAFTGFGRPVLAPASGVIVTAHEGEPDGVARRAPLVLWGFALTQAQRVRAGIAAVAGNHVVIALDGRAGFLWVVHLRRGSVRVAVGDRVALGEEIGECGNSGNSTEPHVHLHVTDSDDPDVARGLPITFVGYRSLTRPGGPATTGMPHNGDVVEPA